MSKSCLLLIKYERKSKYGNCVQIRCCDRYLIEYFFFFQMKLKMDVVEAGFNIVSIICLLFVKNMNKDSFTYPVQINCYGKKEMTYFIKVLYMTLHIVL